jgi:hypothetical protein
VTKHPLKWFMRRIFRRVKQRHPIEVYYNGKLVLAGSGTITTSDSQPTTIVFDRSLPPLTDDWQDQDWYRP